MVLFTIIELEKVEKEKKDFKYENVRFDLKKCNYIIFPANIAPVVSIEFKKINQTLTH